MKHLSAFLAFAFLCALPAAAQERVADLSALDELSIEELLTLQVVTATKSSQPAWEVASSLHIITSDDLRRAGVTSLPEALRLAPGLHVARIDMNNYMVSGATNQDYFTDKLLVLIDGRTLQSPTFSRVFWPAQMYPIEDIDRIEVIRGSGSALWGANAMNGVINIITKKATATAGPMAAAGAGKREKGFSTLRYGGQRENFAWRAYAMGRETGDARFVRGERSDEPKDFRLQDNYQWAYQGGFRADWRDATATTSLHGDAYNVTAMAEGANFVRPGIGTVHYVHDDRYRGQNIALSHERSYDGYRAKLTTYVDRAGTHTIFYEEDLLVVDGEAQLDMTLPYQTLTTGATYRHYSDIFHGTGAMDKPSETGYVMGLYLQDEIKLLDNRLKLILGAKAERSGLSDWEIQPNAKAAWIENNWMVWASAARAVRMPTSVNNGLRWVNDSLHDVDGVAGWNILGIVDTDITPSPEEVYSYEAGTRLHPHDAVSVDVSAFMNRYSNLLSLFAESTLYPGEVYEEGWPEYEWYRQSYLNAYTAQSYGATAEARVKPTPWLDLFAAYTYTRIFVERKADQGEDRTDDYLEYLAGSTPLYAIKTGLRLALPYRVTLDLTGHYAERLDAINVWSNYRQDARLAWRPINDLEVSLVATNILKERQMEWYSPSLFDNAWVNRDWFAKVQYGF